MSSAEAPCVKRRVVESADAIHFLAPDVLKVVAAQQFWQCAMGCFTLNARFQLPPKSLPASTHGVNQVAKVITTRILPGARALLTLLLCALDELVRTMPSASVAKTSLSKMTGRQLDELGKEGKALGLQLQRAFGAKRLGALSWLRD